MEIKKIDGVDYIRLVYCKDCIESEPEDKHMVYCGLKGKMTNKLSLCEAMRPKHNK